MTTFSLTLEFYWPATLWWGKMTYGYVSLHWFVSVHEYLQLHLVWW